MNKILILAGPSAVGKTTVADYILKSYPSFSLVRSATTRAKRGDGHDAEYIYLSREEFNARLLSGKMLEHTEYANEMYGTPASEIERIFDVRLFDVSLDDFEQIEYKYYPKKDK